ncbi:MAG: SOS response-associated peptidase [Woeseiaceae bacterium]|nr:SOS response-associated peptidase [Woeseiaceae bacterium]
MCGRFAFYSPAEATAALFGVTNAKPVEARYNIAPTQYVAAVRNGESGDRELVMLRWGLVPFWAKDPSIGNRMINARAETVAEKPAYRAAYRHRRCVVLADGFYEWKREGDRKTPYYISLDSGEPFALAALWENWHDRESDEQLQSTTLITTAANEFMTSLHHRMPMVLKPGDADAWIGGDSEMIERADELCPPLRAWPVDRRVNNARNEGEDLIEAAGETPDS